MVEFHSTLHASSNSFASRIRAAYRRRLTDPTSYTTLFANGLDALFICELRSSGGGICGRLLTNLRPGVVRIK